MILIVDDKHENVFSLKSILELNHFEVDTALSGEEALRKVLKNAYALIILDVQMPGMDGFEVAEAISGLNKSKDIPIIFLSAINTHKKYITRGFESGGVDYIPKPVDPDILILKVRTFYRLYEQTHQLNETKNNLQKEIEVRKEAELALKATLKELHSTLESLPQIAFTATPDGKIDFVNKYWYAYSEQQHAFPETHPNDGDIAAQWKLSVESGKALERELRIKKVKSNSYDYHLLRVIPVNSNHNIVKWVGTFTDITEQKEMNDLLEQKVNERTVALQEANKKLEISNHDLQQFASVASHDLQEPIRKISTFSSILKNKPYAQENTEITYYLNKILTSSGRMSRLINDLLNFSKLSDTTEFEKSDLNAIIDEILVDLELIIKEKKAVIQVGRIPRLPVMPGLIRQVFQNVISNALKFSKEDTDPLIIITASLTSSADNVELLQPGKEYCMISIKDNGIGFDLMYANKIFTLFQRLNSRDKYEGTGIGLAIAKKVVDKHNGKIVAKSHPGDGAEFIIYLPLEQH